MTRLIKLFASPVAIHVLVAFLVGGYWLVRVLAFSGLGGDEAEMVLFAQSFEWGYDVANPPLYTWILIAVFTLVGKSIPVLLALKMLVLASIYAALYQAARLSLGRGRELDWGLVALSPLLIFLISWHAIFSYSHSLLYALFVILTFIAILKVIEGGKARWYLTLGLLFGLGMLTKYSYGMFLIGIVGAALTLEGPRQRILSVKFLASIVVAVAVSAPHFIWLVGSIDLLQQAINYKLQVGEETSYVSGVIRGLWSLLRATFAFVSPLWLLLLVVFPSLINRRENDQPPYSSGRLLGRSFIIIAASMMLMVLFGATQFRPNYLFLFVLVPLWAFLQLPAERMPGRRREIFGGVLVGAAVMSLGGLVTKAVIDPFVCSKCQLLMPYEAIANELKAQGYGDKAIRASWYPNALPGNLALYMPDAVLASTKFRHLPISPSNKGYECIILWMAYNRVGPVGDNYPRIEQDPTLIRNQKSMSFPLPRAPEKVVVLNYADWVASEDQFNKYCR